MRRVVALLAVMLAASCGEGLPGGLGLGAGDSASAEMPPDTAQTDAPEPETEAPAETEMAAAQPAEESNRSFLAALFGGNARAAAPEETADGEARVVEAALVPEGGNAAPESEIAFGTRLPYGQVARICGLSGKQMGKTTDQYPDSRPVYRLYDSDPGNTEPHSFYLTGFADGCARQFTAALAVFGSVEMHEQLRYGLPAEVQPYSDTDKAYERLKRRVCGKPRRKPCGARIDRLARDTVFVSIYGRFDSNAQWMNLLLHRGEMVAQDNKQAVEG